MSQTHNLTISSAIEICSKPDHYSKELLYAACTLLASTLKAHRQDNSERPLSIHKLKEKAAQAYINIYNGDEIGNPKHLKRLFKYLDSTYLLYSKICEQSRSSSRVGSDMPEVGLIAKYVKRDKDIVGDILNRLKAVKPHQTSNADKSLSTNENK